MSPGAPIIVGDTLVTMAGDTLNMLSLADGSVVKSAKMQASSGYGLTAPTYADGMIIAPLSKGTIEAFDAATLESKWVYTDKLGGQSLSPVLYADGKLYVGFWNDEAEDEMCIRDRSEGIIALKQSNHSMTVQNMTDANKPNVSASFVIALPFER